jgi:hypothetical protein
MFEFLLYHRFDDYGTVSRTIFVDVACEQCGHCYGHALTRSRRAIGDRYVWQAREKYREKWLAQARRELDAKLARAVEVVPCPHCGWIQSRMLDRARQERYPAETWPGLFAFILAMIALAGLFVLWELEKAFQLNWVTAWISLSATFGLMVCCGGLCIVREALRARRYDPNSAPQEERIELGRQRSLSWEQFQALYPADAAIQMEQQKAAACRTETSV